MFLHKLYKYNKLLFFTCIFILFLFVYLNFKWGMVASPINQYGMFSEKFFIKDTHVIYSIQVNSNPILQHRLSAIDIDFIQSYPGSFESQRSKNEMVYGFMKKMLGPLLKDTSFLHCRVNDKEFYSWYTNMLHKREITSGTSIKLLSHQLQWKVNNLSDLDSSPKIIFIAP